MDPDDPDLYLANEDVQVGGYGQHFIDPEAMTRANHTHAKLQNELRALAKKAGGNPCESNPQRERRPPRRRNQKGRLTIAEVKSLTDTNEAHQLRYGLGQLLDYTRNTKPWKRIRASYWPSPELPRLSAFA